MSKKQNVKLRNEWERRIAIYQTSGMNQTKWCEANDLSIHQFKYWLKKLKSSSDVQETETNSKWIPISLEDEIINNEGIQIKVGQAVIDVKSDFNPTLLVNVVKVLQTLC